MSTLRLLFSFAVVAVFIDFAAAAVITVGAPGGSWDLSTNLKTWASTQKFSVSDNLVFQYGAMHSVLEVTKADYDSCNINNPITSSTDGNTIIVLSSVGKRYFICGSSGHCDSGMKIEVDIVASSVTPSTPSKSPPSPISPTTSPATPTSPGNSSNSPLKSPLPSPEPLPSDISPPPKPSSSSRKEGHLVFGFGFGLMIILSFV